MNDEEREEEHLGPFLLVNKELFLTRYERDPKLSNLHTAATSQELRRVWKTERSAKFIYQERNLIDKRICNMVNNIIIILNLLKKVRHISPPPVVVVVQVDDAVCALLADGLGLGLDVVGAGGVHPDPLHDGQHPPDTTQEVQTGHNGNTQPGKESEVRFVKHLILESQGNKKV